MSSKPAIARNSVLNVMRGFAGKENFITTPLTFIDFCDGDHIIAMFFSQCLYWVDRTDDPEGWIVKTNEEWYEEMRLSRSQVERCIKALAKIGLKTKKARSRFHSYAPVIHFKFDMEMLNEKAEKFFADPFAGKSQMRGLRKSNLRLSSKSEMNVSNESEVLDLSKSLYTETITETTEDKKETTLRPAIADRERAASPSHTPSVADEADDASMFKKPSTRQLSAQAENGTKRLTAAQTPSPSLKQKPPTAENTTPHPPIAAAPPSPAAEMQAAPEAIEKGVSITPEKKVAKRSEKQMINDARIEALRVALAVGRGKEPIALEGREISNYSKVANELVEGGVPVEDFLPYVQYWNKAAQGWPGGLTLNSLIKPGRITDFKTWHKTRKKAVISDSMPYQVSTTTDNAYGRYDPASDPAYAPRGEKAQ